MEVFILFTEFINLKYLLDHGGSVDRFSEKLPNSILRENHFDSSIC